MKSENIEELVNLITTEPSEESEERVRYKCVSLVLFCKTFPGNFTGKVLDSLFLFGSHSEGEKKTMKQKLLRKYVESDTQTVPCG